MRIKLLAAAAAACVMLGSAAQAQDPAAGAAAGATIGAGTGFIVGGPVGAAVGAGVGGVIGAGAADQNRPRAEERVIIEQREAPVRQRNCTTNAAGTTVCEEVR